MYKPSDEGVRGYLMAELPDHERPRERLWRVGGDALSDSELVAIMLRSGRRGRSALDLGRDLLRSADGDLNALAHQTVSELQQLPGVGPAKAAQIHAAFTLARRLAAPMRTTAPKLDSPARVVDLMREVLRGKSQEEFHALLLSVKHTLLRDEVVTVGLLDRSHVHAREVFRGAIRESCARILLVHNHPSGDPTPSEEDVRATKKLAEAGKIVGIDILDHVVIGAAEHASPGREFASFRERGLL